MSFELPDRNVEPRIGAPVDEQMLRDALRGIQQNFEALERRLAAGAGMEHLGAFALADSNRQFQFNEVPQGYRSLKIIGTAKSTAAVQIRQLGMWMNGFTSNYYNQETYQDDGGAPVPFVQWNGAHARIGAASGASSPNDNYWGHTEIIMPRYSAAIGVKGGFFRSQVFLGYGTPRLHYKHGAFTQDFTGAPITSLAIVLDPYEAFNVATSAFDLYGIA